jgi:IstB-like ATP binding protein
MSPGDVRARLAQVDAGSAGAIAIGSETMMTKGFAEEWLAWKDQRKAEREDRFRQMRVFWTRWAALAASIAAAYERGSTVVTSNLPFDEWTSVFGSERLSGALLDRLTHHVHILQMNGDSYRLNQSKRRSHRASSDTPVDNPTQA